MFKNLTNFDYKRNRKEAIGFYLTYLLLCVITAALIAVIVGEVTSGGLPQGIRIGMDLSAIECAVLSLAVLAAKKETRFGFILLALIGGMLTLFIGGLLAFIIPAYFTTLHSSTIS